MKFSPFLQKNSQKQPLPIIFSLVAQHFRILREISYKNRSSHKSYNKTSIGCKLLYHITVMLCLGDVVTSQLLKAAISRKVYIFRQRCSHEKCLVFRAVYDRPISFLEFRSHNFIDREWAPVKARGHHVTPEVASKKYQPGK